LESVRQTILAAAPGIDETIRYNIPTYTVRGKALVHFAGWKLFTSLYPVPDGDELFQQRIASYRAGKSTLRFSLALPIPLDLVTSVVRHLLGERS
jgi:uncharacterized protein YdhG (YjbR/CyaY superfamily)